MNSRNLLSTQIVVPPFDNTNVVGQGQLWQHRREQLRVIVLVVELTPRCAMLRSKRSSAEIHFLPYPAREHAEPILQNPNEMVVAVPDGMYALAFEIGSFDTPSGCVVGTTHR